MFFIPFLSSKYRENGQVQSNLDFFFFFFFLPPSCCCCCSSQNVDELPVSSSSRNRPVCPFSCIRNEGRCCSHGPARDLYQSSHSLFSQTLSVCVCVCVLALTTLSGRAHTSLGININANRPAMSRSTRPLDVLGCFFVLFFSLRPAVFSFRGLLLLATVPFIFYPLLSSPSFARVHATIVSHCRPQDGCQ